MATATWLLAWLALGLALLAVVETVRIRRALRRFGEGVTRAQEETLGELRALEARILRLERGAGGSY